MHTNELKLHTNFLYTYRQSLFSYSALGGNSLKIDTLLTTCVQCQVSVFIPGPMLHATYRYVPFGFHGAFAYVRLGFHGASVDSRPCVACHILMLGLGLCLPGFPWCSVQSRSVSVYPWPRVSCRVMLLLCPGLLAGILCLMPGVRGTWDCVWLSAQPGRAEPDRSCSGPDQERERGGV